MGMTTQQTARVVLVGDDLAEGGAEAIAQGHAMAVRYGARLRVCHAIPDPGPIEALLGLVDSERGSQIAQLQQNVRQSVMSRVRRITDRSDVDVSVLLGSPHGVVLDEARRVHANWIVVAASSKKITEERLLGSSASQVVRHAACTVLVARPDPVSDVVLVATDLSDPALPAIEQAIEESNRRESKLIALHVLDLAHPLLSSIDPAVVIDEHTAAVIHESARATLASALARFGGIGETEVVQGSPKRAVVDVARRVGAGLIVVSTHGRSGLARVALGSVAEAVVQRASCSLMVARERAS